MAADSKTRDTVASLLNYDVSDGEDDPFREIDTGLDVSNDNKRGGSKRKFGNSNDKDSGEDSLGLDEEVKIAKKRAPVVKLDEARLLSEPGIPKLRALARSQSIRSRLRLKGKGHEYSDAAKLLGYYQLWLDNLYPRAKFADGLQLVEKVGHGKRMQVMRREWIDESKPKYGQNEDEVRGVEAAEETDRQLSHKQPEAESTAMADCTAFGDLDEDETELFFADARAGGNHYNDNEPDEDELDALLAERGDGENNHRHPRSEVDIHHQEDDDLDGLLEEQRTDKKRVARMTQQFHTGRKPEIQFESKFQDAEEENDELEAGLAETVLKPLDQ